MAYNKEKLVKIGKEGFVMVEEWLGRKAPPQQMTSCRYQYQPEESRVYVVTPTKDASALDCYEAANTYGGTVIVDYPNRKSTRVAYYQP